MRSAQGLRDSLFKEVNAMNKYIESLFGLDGKVVLLTGAGGFLVGELSRAAGRRAGNPRRQGE